jgi:hypothetical protein
LYDHGVAGIERTRRFLRAVRLQALLVAGLKTSSFTLAAALVVLLLLSLWAARTGAAAFWPGVTAALVSVTVVATLGLGCLRPLRDLRSERAVAAFVGRLHPPLKSDLLSAVELAVPAGQPIPHGGSPVFADAFQTVVAEEIAPVEPGRLVPLRSALGPVLVALVAVLLFVGLAAGTARVRRGLEFLVHNPTRFEGAQVVREPLVGDLRLTCTYPRYTGLRPRVIDGSTGDISVLKGTRVRIEARPLRQARTARLLIGEDGQEGELPVAIDADRLIAQLTIHQSTSYRFWLSPLLGRAVREARPRQIVMQADRPPEVDIRGPRDVLSLPSPRPVEVSVSARDDFGLGAVELVYSVNDGPAQRVSLGDASGARTFKDTTLFEPSLGTALSGALQPGSRVAYRVEAKDQDAVSGAKTGSSRTLYLVIQNPHDEFYEKLAREREQLEKLLEALAGKLETAKRPLQASPEIAALETAVLRLDDRLAHQQLKELAALAQTLADSYKWLQDLMARSSATQDEAQRRLLERAVRELQSRIGELVRKIAAVKTRNEVPMEWQNMPDPREAQALARQLGEQLAKGKGEGKGDAAALSKLADLGRSLESLRQMLQSKADDFGIAHQASLGRSGGQQQIGGDPHSGEPVRIPTLDDSKAPRAWREELMEAMRGPVPDRFRAQVRRYYEALVR